MHFSVKNENKIQYQHTSSLSCHPHPFSKLSHSIEDNASTADHHSAADEYEGNKDVEFACLEQCWHDGNALDARIRIILPDLTHNFGKGLALALHPGVGADVAP